MAKAATRRTPKQSPTPILRLLPTPAAPHPHCQAVADGLAQFKNEALHGMHVGALLMVIHPDGCSTWAAYGTLGGYDDATANAAAGLTNSVFRDCWKGA